jgi:hypothetical protein
LVLISCSNLDFSLKRRFAHLPKTMQKSLLRLFLILNCWLSGIQPVLANRQDEWKVKMAEQLNKPIDYTDLSNLKSTFDYAIIVCLNANDTLAIEKVNKLVHDLNLYWKVAYQVAQKHSSKKRLKKKEKSLIQDRLIVINSVGSQLVTLDKNLDSGLPEATSMLTEAIEVGEKIFPGSVLLADAYDNFARSCFYRHDGLIQRI